MSGLEIARRGGRAADPKSARREALADIRRQALVGAQSSADETARLCELAAANPDLRAGPLLEAYGQGAVGPIRTLAWWRRNGCRVQKGERAVLISMFGNAFYGRKQVIGPDPGPVGTRRTPPNAFPDVREGLALGILRARAGEWLRAVWTDSDPFADPPEEQTLVSPAAVAPLVDLAELERALAEVAAYDATATECLSCAGTGCVLCACQDDRQPVRRVDTLPPVPRLTPKPVKRRKPRPKKQRPTRIVQVQAGLEAAARLRAEAAQLEAMAKGAISEGIRQARAEGYSLRDIGATMGVSAVRIQQLENAGRD